MSSDPKARVATSVREKLLTLAKSKGVVYDMVLNRYALERFLYRLSISPSKSDLVLKGAMLFQIWNREPHRATRDLDLLARGATNPETIEKTLRSICEVEVEEDGLSIDKQSILVTAIREEAEYGGFRAKFIVRLGSAKIPVQIDFGFGDAITPAATESIYPTLLGMSEPVLFVYPRETVVAEKLEAIVRLGMDNSRMKDYFDLWFIATTYQDDTSTLTHAISETFHRRRQPVPGEIPVGLTDSFATDPQKQRQWRAFLDRAVGSSLSLQEVVQAVRSFATPLFEGAWQISLDRIAP